MKAVIRLGQKSVRTPNTWFAPITAGYDEGVEYLRDQVRPVGVGDRVAYRPTAETRRLMTVAAVHAQLDGPPVLDLAGITETAQYGGRPGDTPGRVDEVPYSYDPKAGTWVFAWAEGEWEKDWDEREAQQTKKLERQRQAGGAE